MTYNYFHICLFFPTVKLLKTSTLDGWFQNFSLCHKNWNCNFCSIHIHCSTYRWLSSIFHSKFILYLKCSFSLLKFFMLRENYMFSIFFFNATKLLSFFEFSLDVLCGKSKIKQSLKTKLSPQLCVFLTAKMSAENL